ncbi:cytidine deaminase [Yersinia phage vB_YenM_P744]
MRITRQEMMRKIAYVIAERSTCYRLKVGAVISYDGRVISTGYNGSRPGHSHCTPETCNPGHRCTRTIHAEKNAINFARLQGVEDFSKMELHITDSPCMDCAKYIVSSGIKTVYYDREYRLMESIEWLRSQGVMIVSYAKIHLPQE